MDVLVWIIGLLMAFLLFKWASLSDQLKKARWNETMALQQSEHLSEHNQELVKRTAKFDYAILKADELRLKNEDLKLKNMELKNKNMELNLSIKNNSVSKKDASANLKLQQENDELKTKLTFLANVKFTYSNYIEKYNGLMLLEKDIAKLQEAKVKGTEIYTKLKTAIDAEKTNYSTIKNNVISISSKLSNMRTQLESYSKELYKHESRYNGDDYELYRPAYSNETPDFFKRQISDNYLEGKLLFEQGKAVVNDSNHYTDEDDISYNRRTQNIIKNMVNLFNSESNQLVSTLTYKNANKTFEKIKKVKDNINKINMTNEHHYFYISEDYLSIKLKEASLKFEFETAKQKYKDEQDAIKSQMREEQREEKKLVKEREIALKAAAKAEKEEQEFEDKLRIAREELEATMAAHLALKEQEGKDKFNAELQEKDNEAKEKELAMNEMISKLEEDLRLAQEAKERNKSMAQQTRSGYVYIISNVGSFGDGVVKIGMTRRLEPMDRVKELGDASVPFGFDVHALIYSKDAPALENELHKQFADNRVNLVNLRKEFFNVHVNDVSNYLLEKGFDMSKMNILPDASEYYESMSIRKMADENGVPVSSIIRDNSINNMFEFVDEEENEEAA
jgi:hypothetical protein